MTSQSFDDDRVLQALEVLGEAHQASDYSTPLGALLALKEKLQLLADLPRGDGGTPSNPDVDAAEGPAEPLTLKEERKLRKKIKKQEKRQAKMDANAGKDEDLGTPSPFPYVFKRVAPGAGYGAFATSAIPRGARVLEEEALLIDETPTVFASFGVLYDMLRLAADSDKSTYDNLAAGPEISARYADIADRWLFVEDKTQRPETAEEKIMLQTLEEIVDKLVQGAKITYDESRIALDCFFDYLSKFERNALLLDRHEKGGKAVFVAASRFNHSCRSNALRTWDSDLKKLTIQATHFIDKGEEITIDWVPEGRYEWHARRNWLRYHYGIDCKCTGCVGPTAEISKTRRARLAELAPVIESWYAPVTPVAITTKAPQRVTRAVNEYLHLLKKERLVSPDISRMYTLKAIFAAERGDTYKVRLYNQHAYRVQAICHGIGHSVVAAAMKQMEQLWELEDDEDPRAVLSLLWRGCQLYIPSGAKIPNASEIQKVLARIIRWHGEGSVSSRRPAARNRSAGAQQPVDTPSPAESDVRRTMLSLEQASWMCRVVAVDPSLSITEAMALCDQAVAKRRVKVD